MMRAATSLGNEGQSGMVSNHQPAGKHLDPRASASDAMTPRAVRHSMIAFAPTTAEHVAALFGGAPTMRLRAVTALVEGKPEAIGGLAYQPDGTAVAVLHGYSIAKRYPVSVHKAVLQGLEQAKARGVRRILALCDEEVEAAPRWLARLGFHEIGDRVWIWEA